jgi:hypothetical protein
MKRMFPFLTALVMAMVVAGSAQAADDKANVMISATMQKLRDCVAELNANDFPKQAKSIEDIADKIAAWTATHASVPQDDLQALQTERDRLEKQIRAWSSSGQTAQANTLTKQVEVLDGICKAFKTVVTDEAPPPTSAPAPAVAAASAPAAPVTTGPAATPGLANLTVLVSMAEPPREAAPKPAPRPNLPARPAGPIEAPKVLTVNLRELNKTFTNLSPLDAYLKENAAKLAATQVTFEITHDVTWEHVQQTLNAFASVPLTREMRLSGVNLRPASTAGVTPAMPGAPMPTVGTPAAPGGPGSPAGSASPLPLGLTPPGPTEAPAADPAAPAAPTAQPGPSVPATQAARGQDGSPGT